ncbi:MAG TPA: FKBP-type peptidyl-prolyl cis-trans isomerase [Vicinamibacterales bacterium]|nr:FKBP-type peptidyl-prolyl cis-trans isomerase [Vicinamibacterales bacterium]
MRVFVCVLALVSLPLLAGCGSSSSSPSTPSTSVGTFTQTDLVVGTGAEATAGKSITVNYTGWLYDTSKTDGKGTQFDSSIGRAPFPLVLGAGQVIKGWDQGIVGMKVGGSRRLIIPPELAYGSAGQSSIPPNATLVFDISLLSVQ